jgi:ketol-acid reductoisomerase
MARVYGPEDIDTAILNDRIIATIGYGFQGRRYALSLRDHGLQVIVGNIRDAYYDQAVADGMEVHSIEVASEKADIVMMLTGDEAQPTIYRERIAGRLRKGKALVFASGFNLYYGFIATPEQYDTLLVAPVTPTVMAVGVERDVSGTAWEIAWALAKVSRSPFHLAVESTFAEEVVTDEFHAAADVSVAVQLAMFELLVEAGYSPEMAYFNTIGWITARVEEAFQKRGCDGLEKAFSMTSNTSHYDKFVYAQRLVDVDFKDRMREYLRKVEDGEIAKEWMLEDSMGRPVLRRLMTKFREHPAIEVERAMLARRDRLQ